MEKSFLIDWQRTPLVPAISQDVKTKQVLMLAYMNQEAYEKTIETGIVHYFSRSKQRIWKKGETSGHIQKVKSIYLDCDNDTILLEIEQNGHACHTGRPSCFFKRVDTKEFTQEAQKIESYSISDTLYHTILERLNSDANSSYVASLFKKGQNSILKKVVEEAGELCFAIKDSNDDEIVYEAADLFFHTLVALASKHIDPDRVKKELERRNGISGIEEKKSRKI